MPMFKHFNKKTAIGFHHVKTELKTKWNDYKQALKPLPLKTAQALDTVYPAFGERKGAKPIVTTSNYGAGMSSISRANARDVIDAFYKGLE